MNDTILEEYAILKVKIKEMQKREAELKPVILEQVEKTGDTNIKKDYGTFVRVPKSSWIYSEDIEKKEEELKIKKLDEQEDGTAEKKETFYLTFKSK